jgi:hypothetical protein
LGRSRLGPRLRILNEGRLRLHAVVRRHRPPAHMNATQITVGLIITLVAVARPSAASRESDSWSQPTNGLQARIMLVEKPKEFGTRWIVPYLELRSVRELALPMEVCCDRRHVQFELVDAAGNAVTNRASLSRSGPVPNLGSIILPPDSSIRISMECRNWGVSGAAMISTDSGAWALQDADRGHIYLRASIVGDRVEDDRYKIWRGKIETPLLKVDWK